VKIAIIGGAGGIGSSVAFNLLRTNIPFEIVIIDNRPNMIVSHVMDLQDALSLGGAKSIRGGELEDAFDADVVVVSAAIPITLNTSRDVYLDDNAALLMGIVDPLVDAGFSGIFVLMTNPVDPLLTWLARRTGWKRERLLGYTLNDSQRFRTGIAQALEVEPQRVECWVVGEHGAGQVPLWQSIRVDGKAVELTEAQKTHVLDYVDNWYVRHVALDSHRTSTWSSGIGGALLIEHIATNSDVPYPVSLLLTGEYGVVGTTSSTPVLLGKEGVRQILEQPLTPEQNTAFIAAAQKISELAHRLPLS
jgi:malate/lactate dehydrogenase